jgi:hypothetical protein
MARRSAIPRRHGWHCQPFVDGRGWELLSPLQRRELRAHHLATGCTVAWPLCSAEVPEMLQRPMPFGRYTRQESLSYLIPTGVGRQPRKGQEVWRVS